MHCHRNPVTVIQVARQDIPRIANLLNFEGIPVLAKTTQTLNIERSVLWQPHIVGRRQHRCAEPT